MASAAATAMAAPPSRAEVLSLLRSLLRTASKFNDYNAREYVKRRSLEAFRENKSLSDPSSVASSFSDGKSQLEVAKRQAMVYSFYAPKNKSIMEIKKL
jgi:LYR motif-containing protein 4